MHIYFQDKGIIDFLQMAVFAIVLSDIVAFLEVGRRGRYVIFRFVLMGWTVTLTSFNM